jgi:hypothetical protein
MIPCPRIPIFIPAYLGSRKAATSECPHVDGEDVGVLPGFIAKVDRGGETVVTRGKGALIGNLLWLDTCHYDEAIAHLDRTLGVGAGRTMSQAYPATAQCLVDCWVYTQSNEK